MSSKAKKSPNVQSLHMQEKMALVNRMEELLTILDSLQNPNINLNKLDKKLFQSSFPKHIEMLQEQTRLMSQLSLDAKPHSTSGTSSNTEFSLSTTEPTTQAFRKHHLSDEATQKERESGNKLIGPPAQHKETDALSTSSSPQPQSVPTSLISALPAPILVPVLVPCTPVQTFLTPPFPSHSQPIPIISGPQSPLVFSGIQTPESSLYQEELRNKLLVIIKEMSSSEPALKGLELDLTKMLLDRWEYWKLLDLFQTPTILKKEIALAFETLQKQQKKKAMEIDEQMLGEKLYRAIQEMSSPPSGATEKICKITGMLLEMEQSEVNNLLENPHDLKEKIEEALAVLEVHQELLKDQKKFVSPDPSREPLNRDNLASVGLSPQEQKQELGEKLFEAVEGMISLQNGCSAGKITGMLLELENSELLHLLNSPKDMKEKVEEAESVLRAHKLLSEDKSSTSAAVGEKRPHGTNLKEEKLNALPPEEQKQMIGEELYTTILKMSISPFVAENIGKIIGMLLEIRNSELLKLLKSQQDLRNKVVEAVAVLEAHENGSKNRKVSTGDGCANSFSAAVGEMRPHGTNLKEEKLNALPPEEQKQVIGEELYTAILKMSISPFVAENIGKIIGMLLEIKNSELLKLLKSQTDLKNKVLEAVAVLEAHENGSKDRELSAGDGCAKLYPNQPTDGDNDGRQHLSTSSSSSLCDDQENKRDPELDEFFDLLKL